MFRGFDDAKVIVLQLLKLKEPSKWCCYDDLNWLCL